MMVLNEAVHPEEVGRRLRKLRGIRTRIGAATEMGISYSALAQYEAGIKIPGDAVKAVIANYYGKTVQQIFFDPEYDETT